MAKNSTEKDSDSLPQRHFKEQFDDEEVMLVFRKHPIVMRKGLIIGSIALLLPMLYILALTFIYANNPDKLPSVNSFYIALGIGFGLAALVMFPHWISWYYSIYIITNQRLIQITQKGMFRRSMVALGLDQIQMINYEIDGLEETLLGFGTIVVQTFVGSLTIHDVHHPAKTQKELLNILRDLGYSMGGGQVDASQLEGEDEE